MRVNPRVFSERMDMLDGVRIPNCPHSNISRHSLRTVCENIVNMFCKPGYACSGYHTMTEADNMIALDYWKVYDGLSNTGDRNTYLFDAEWFIRKATPWEAIRRSREWLVQHNYLIPDSSVSEHAIQAGEKFARSVKR